MSPGVLAELRKLRPGRQLTRAEALHVAEQQAARLLKLGGLSSATDAPVAEELIAHLPRFVVRRYPLGTGIAGTADWLDGRWCIALNSHEPLVRQRFSLAHELGHILEAPFDRYARPRDVERVADHFAACLLMPRTWVKRLWGEGLQEPRQLARRFEVSREAMTRRLSDLRLDQETDDQPDAAGRHGRRYFRRSHPLQGGWRAPIIY